MSDVQNEWSVNYPFLPDIFILLANSTYVVNRKSFERSLDLVKSDLASRYPNLGHGLSADGILSIMYSIGLVGVVRNGKTQYIFHDRTERRIQPQDKEFVIHPCFRSSLKATSAINIVPFQLPSESAQIAIRTSLQRGSRINTFETVRGAPFQRILYYTDSSLDALRAAVLKALLPEDLREELRSNFRAMQLELRQALEFGSEERIINLAERMYGHLNQVHSNLKDRDWLREDKELGYRLEEITKELEGYFFRGATGDYR